MAEAKKFDRSKFKDTVTATQLKAEDQKVDNLTEKNNNNGGYVGYHKIVDGENKHRIYPAHPNDKGHSFIVPVQRWWLEVEVSDRDEKGAEKKDKSGKVILKKVRKRVFDGRIHSTVERDIVDEYIKFLTKKLKEDGLDDSEVSEKLLPVNGSYAKKINGITGKPEWIMYTDLISGTSKTFAKLLIGKAVKMRINDLIARESADEPIGSESTNPFTDPDEGRLMEITYNSKATQANDYYKTEIDSSYNKETKMINFYPLSDEELDKFMTYPSLADQYINCYTTADFDLALEGLKNLDKAQNYGVFDYDEFLDICEELSKVYPEKEDKVPVSDKKSTDKIESVIESDEVEEEEGLDISKMDRAQLKTYIKEAELDVIVRTSMSDKDIRDAIEQSLAAEIEEEAPEEIIDEVEEDEVNDEVEDEEKDDLAVLNKKPGRATKTLSAADRIAALKAKSKSGK